MDPRPKAEQGQAWDELVQAGIRVPQDLRLVLHRNAEVGLFCPVPVAFVDVHIAEVAAALITQAGGRRPSSM